MPQAYHANTIAIFRNWKYPFFVSRHCAELRLARKAKYQVIYHRFLNVGYLKVLEVFSFHYRQVKGTMNQEISFYPLLFVERYDNLVFFKFHDNWKNQLN